VVLAVALGLSAWLIQRLNPASRTLPPILGWKTLAEKQAAAEYLNRKVKLPDFEAEVHKVEEGENFWSVAFDYEINIDTIVGLNPELSSFYARLGQPLLVATRRGSLHQVGEGESLAQVAEAYHVSPTAVADANRLSWFGLKPGELLFIPGAKPRLLSDEMGKLYARRRLFRSPLSGTYTSLVGERHDPFTGDVKRHNGVDIRAPFNAWVSAPASGKVSLAGWNGGYGKCVIIDHGNGYKTLCGHLNTVLVKQGQHVRQGQMIGRVGSTGRTTGPHLHFTIYLKNKVQDPLKYLW
jgi:murein DD-endopeptidase MepM/ murein hydrolase activator NlpD